MKTRRRFCGVMGAAALAARGQTSAGGQAGIDAVLRSGIAKRKVPAVVGMAASKDKTLYAGAFGVRDNSGTPVRVDSIFQIASMTKAITTTAALQLVEQGKVGLDEPVSRYLPVFSKVKVWKGYAADGRPRFQPPAKPVTLRHLVTHTSGLCYDRWDGDAFRLSQKHKPEPGIPGPLVFEPGARWQYGQGIDWAGRLVEAVSGLSLEEYFQQKILRPLGMADTSYILPAGKFDRMVTGWRRKSGSPLEQNERKLPEPSKTFNGGGGLYSTAADYVRFMQMILNDGVGRDGVRILQAKTVESMKVNQIGASTAGKMKSYDADFSSDVDVQPGQTEKWSLAFLLNTTAYEGGRSAGSLAWAGLYNTFYWIDPARSLCGVILMQFLPFVDKEAVGMLGDFERAVYAAKLG